MEQAEGPTEKQPKIRRGRVDSLSLYEITDYELDVLTTGSPSSIFLNFAIFLISVASSFLVALLSTTIANRVFTVFVVVTVLGFIIGIVLIGLWARNRKSMSEIIRRIKARIPPDHAEDD